MGDGRGQVSYALRSRGRIQCMGRATEHERGQWRNEPSGDAYISSEIRETLTGFSVLRNWASSNSSVASRASPVRSYTWPKSGVRVGSSRSAARALGSSCQRLRIQLLLQKETGTPGRRPCFSGSRVIGLGRALPRRRGRRRCLWPRRSRSLRAARGHLSPPARSDRRRRG